MFQSELSHSSATVLLMEMKGHLVGFGEKLSGELIQVFIDLLQGSHLLLQLRHSYFSVLSITKHALKKQERETVKLAVLFIVALHLMDKEKNEMTLNRFRMNYSFNFY